MKRNNCKNAEEVKILFVSQEMSYTGSPRSLLRMCRILQKNNYHVSVWSYKYGEFVKEFEKYDIQVEIIPETYFSDNSFIKDKVKQFSLAICNTVITGVAFECLKKYIPSIWYIREAHNLENFCNMNNLFEKLLKNSIGLYCVSEYARDYIHSKFASNAIVLHNATEDFNCEFPRTYFNNERLNLLCMGTFEYRKSFDTLVNAIIKLPQNIRKKIKLRIAGELREEKSFKDYYLPILKEIENIPEIEYIGVIKDIEDKKKLYLSSDVVCVPSRDEACSLVALEGIACGCPVILSENVGAKYIINENTGWLFKTNDVDALSQILQNILIGKYDISYMGKCARKKYEETSNMEAYEQNLLQMVKKSIRNKNLIEKDIKHNKIFSVEFDDEHIYKIVVIFGLKIKFKCKKYAEYSLLEKIFSIKNHESRNNNWYKVITVLGFKAKFRNEALTQKHQLQRLEQKLNDISNI